MTIKDQLVFHVLIYFRFKMLFFPPCFLLICVLFFWSLFFLCALCGEILKEMKNGLLFMVSAPSGTGKTTLCRAMTQVFPGLHYSISYTTRPPDPGTENGRDTISSPRRSSRRESTATILPSGRKFTGTGMELPGPSSRKSEARAGTSSSISTDTAPASCKSRTWREPLFFSSPRPSRSCGAGFPCGEPRERRPCRNG